MPVLFSILKSLAYYTFRQRIAIDISSYAK